MTLQNHFKNRNLTVAISILLGVSSLLLASTIQAMPKNSSSASMINMRAMSAETAGLNTVKNTEDKNMAFNSKANK